MEISDLLSLLKLLDNPLQDIPALAVLHSPLVGLTINDLATIRLAGKGPFWTTLGKWSQESGARSQSRGVGISQAQEPGAGNEIAVIDHQSLRTKVSTFLEQFARWRRLARQVSLSRCLDAILSETHYTAWLLTQPRGEQRHAH